MNNKTIENALTNLLVYAGFFFLLFIGIDVVLEFAWRDNVSNWFAFWPAIIALYFLVNATFQRTYRVVKPDTLLITYDLFVKKIAGETSYNSYTTGVNITSIFEEDEATISLKNNSNVVKDFKVSTKNSHILIEVQYEWEVDVDNIAVLYRNAQNMKDIVKDINQKLDTTIKATVESLLSGEDSLHWVKKAGETIEKAKNDLLTALEKEEELLGIKLIKVRLGNIDLSEAESKSRVTAVMMENYSNKAKTLVTASKVDGKPTLSFNEAMKIVLANEGKAKISSQKLDINADGATIILPASGSSS